MQWHRDDQVDGACERRGDFCHESAEGRSEIAAALVLVAVERVSDWAAVVEDGGRAGGGVEECGAGGAEGVSGGVVAGWAFWWG